MRELIHTDWRSLLNNEFEKDYFIKLNNFLNTEYKTKIIYPARDNIFNALNFTPFNDVKVVILGQDPYHGENQAHGLSFSVNKGIKIPPSLLNIYKELKDDLNCYIPNNGYLKDWADQGILLLNTILTVEAHKANSHKGAGWEKFTDKIISLLNDRKEPIVFILWGNNAISKKNLITNMNHFVITSPHPSPLSSFRGFFGSKPFSKTNNFLNSINSKAIDWQIKNI